MRTPRVPTPQFFRRRHGAIFLALALCLPAIWKAQGADKPAFREIVASQEHIAQIRKGGFVLYVRHGLTDNSHPDQVPVDLNDCKTQRPLSDEGRQIARRVGEHIAKSAIPIGHVYASAMCRAQETARAIFPGRNIIVEENLRYLANMTAEEKLPIIERTRALLAAEPAAGKNTVIVAHAPNLMEIMEYFPPEGSMVIFRPDSTGNFIYMASIHPSHWDRLHP